MMRRHSLQLASPGSGRPLSSRCSGTGQRHQLLLVIDFVYCLHYMVLRLSLGRLLGLLVASRNRTGTGTGTFMDCSVFLIPTLRFA
jgi:hypothetical protein